MQYGELYIILLCLSGGNSVYECIFNSININWFFLSLFGAIVIAVIISKLQFGIGTILAITLAIGGSFVLSGIGKMTAFAFLVWLGIKYNAWTHRGKGLLIRGISSLFLATSLFIFNIGLGDATIAGLQVVPVILLMIIGTTAFADLIEIIPEHIIKSFGFVTYCELLL